MKRNRKATLAVIKSARGSLKRKPGDKPFAEQWAEYKRTEKELEDRLDRREHKEHRTEPGR